MAEAVRFELTIQLPVCLLSRQMPSATRPRFLVQNYFFKKIPCSYALTAA